MQMSRAIDRDRVHLVSVPAASAVEVSVSPVALFPALDRGKWQIAAAVLIALLIGGCYAYIHATPLYRSTAVLKLAPHQDQIVDFQSAAGRLSRDAAEVNSEVEVLRARGLMQQVVARLDLTADPEFNHELRGQSVVGRMASWARIGAAGGDLSRDEKEQRVRDGVISKLLEAVTIRNIPLSLVFQISVVTEDARKSALIADTIVDLYISNQIKTKFEATEQATLWLTERVAEGVVLGAADQYAQRTIFALFEITHANSYEFGAPGQKLIAQTQHGPVPQPQRRVRLTRKEAVEIGARHALCLFGSARFCAADAAQRKIDFFVIRRVFQLQQPMHLTDGIKAPSHR